MADLRDQSYEEILKKRKKKESSRNQSVATGGMSSADAPMSVEGSTGDRPSRPRGGGGGRPGQNFTPADGGMSSADAPMSVEGSTGDRPSRPRGGGGGRPGQKFTPSGGGGGSSGGGGRSGGGGSSGNKGSSQQSTQKANVEETKTPPKMEKETISKNQRKTWLEKFEEELAQKRIQEALDEAQKKGETTSVRRAKTTEGVTATVTTAGRNVFVQVPGKKTRAFMADSDITRASVIDLESLGVMGIDEQFEKAKASKAEREFKEQEIRRKEAEKKAKEQKKNILLVEDPNAAQSYLIRKQDASLVRQTSPEARFYSAEGREVSPPPGKTAPRGSISAAERKNIFEKALGRVETGLSMLATQGEARTFEEVQTRVAKGQSFARDLKIPFDFNYLGLSFSEGTKLGDIVDTRRQRADQELDRSLRTASLSFASAVFVGSPEDPSPQGDKKPSNLERNVNNQFIITDPEKASRIFKAVGDTGKVFVAGFKTIVPDTEGAVVDRPVTTAAMVGGSAYLVTKAAAVAPELTRVGVGALEVLQIASQPTPEGKIKAAAQFAAFDVALEGLARGVPEVRNTIRTRKFNKKLKKSLEADVDPDFVFDNAKDYFVPEDGLQTNFVETRRLRRGELVFDRTGQPTGERQLKFVETTPETDIQASFEQPALSETSVDPSVQQRFTRDDNVFAVDLRPRVTVEEGRKELLDPFEVAIVKSESGKERVVPVGQQKLFELLRSKKGQLASVVPESQKTSQDSFEIFDSMRSSQKSQLEPKRSVEVDFVPASKPETRRDPFGSLLFVQAKEGPAVQEMNAVDLRQADVQKNFMQTESQAPARMQRREQINFFEQEQERSSRKAQQRQPARIMARQPAKNLKKATRQVSQSMKKATQPRRTSSPINRLLQKTQRTSTIKPPKFPGTDKKKTGSFRIQVRTNNKFITKEANIKDLVTASKKAQQEVGGSARRSFRILDQFGRVVQDLPGIGKEFRRSKKDEGVFIEKTEFAINTPGEFQEITAKGILSSKKKNKVRFL